MASIILMSVFFLKKKKKANCVVISESSVVLSFWSSMKREVRLGIVTSLHYFTACFTSFQLQKTLKYLKTLAPHYHNTPQEH